MTEPKDYPENPTPDDVIRLTFPISHSCLMVALHQGYCSHFPTITAARNARNLDFPGHNLSILVISGPEDREIIILGSLEPSRFRFAVYDDQAESRVIVMEEVPVKR